MASTTTTGTCWPTKRACATDHPEHLGLTARETIPDEVDSWLPHFAEVARSGQSVRFANGRSHA